MTIATDGFGTAYKTGEGSGAGGGNGVEILTAVSDAPQGNLDLSVQVSILINSQGNNVRWHLPDASDGMIKEIVSSPPSGGANQFIGITCTNALGNDLLDLNAYQSARLVWTTAGGGWVVTSVCSNLFNFWD